VLIAFELVETSAGGGEQYDIARLGCGAGLANCILERFGVDYFRTFYLGLDLCCGCTDRVDALYALTDQVVEHGVIATFILAAQNQVDVRGKGL
jgi:hypothetical protein